MANNRVYIPVRTAEYAAIHGISQRTARRRIAASPGAVKLGGKWNVPETASTVAKHRGVSTSTLRKSKTSLRAASPEDLKDVIRQRAYKPGSRSRQVAEDHYITLLAKRQLQRPVNEDMVRERLQHATPTQLRRINKLQEVPATAEERADFIDLDQWEGDDEDSVLYYH